MGPKWRRGFTLIEMMMGASIMAVVSAALIGAFLGQASLNATARNLTAAMRDATRVMEQIREQNTVNACAARAGLPSAKPPSPYTSWDAWLGGGKSIPATRDTPFELVAVTCIDGNFTGAIPLLLNYCGDANQVGGGEWRRLPGISTTFNPIRVTVATGWVQGQRAIGQSEVTSGKQSASRTEFTYTAEHTTSGKTQTIVPASFRAGPDANLNGVLESQAMLSTLVTCR